MADSTLRGKLLIAGPQLHDYFRRTVVLVLEHSDEGAIGVVLNRESETEVAEAVPVLAALADDGDFVRVGGPVSPTAVVALGDFDDPGEAATQVVGRVGLVDPDAADPNLRRLRVYAGYAGWAPEQLEGELDEDAWIVVPAEPDDPWYPGDLWSDALRRKGGSYAMIATMPADPSLN